MFSRCSSLGSLSSFDTQSVHSSVVSEYSRRASQVVSPSELPDSPSQTMPPSPPRLQSPPVPDDRSRAHGPGHAPDGHARAPDHHGHAPDHAHGPGHAPDRHSHAHGPGHRAFQTEESSGPSDGMGVAGVGVVGSNPPVTSFKPMERVPGGGGGVASQTATFKTGQVGNKMKTGT